VQLELAADRVLGAQQLVRRAASTGMGTASRDKHKHQREREGGEGSEVEGIGRMQRIG